MFFRKIKEGNPFESPSHNTTCVFRGLVYNLHINPHQPAQRIINGIRCIPVAQVGHLIPQSFPFLGPKIVIGASVHPHPPYQDLQVVRFLHSVQFFGSILTSLHTDGDQQVNTLQTAGQTIQRSVRIEAERCSCFCWAAPRRTFIVSISNKRTHRGAISAG